MKRTLIIALITAALCGTVHSQTTQLTSPVGVGISSAYGDLHIHESNYTEPVPIVEPSLRDGAYPGNFYTTFRMTNTYTSNFDNDGFIIEQKNSEVSLRQLERGNLYLYGPNRV